MGARFDGSWVALPTPFRDGALDLDALRGLIDRQAASATVGIVVAGTTGEAATLTDAEREELLDAALAAARGRLGVLAGVGTNATAATVELARRAEAQGADGLLVVAPYYNRPGPRGLLAHYSAVAEAVAAPLVLYNVPGRTASDVTPDVAGELARRHANVVAIKEASGEVARARALRDAGLDVLAGDDGLLRAWIEAGAVGAVGVVSNLVPDEVAELLRAAAGAAPGRAAELEALLAPLVRALFAEPNPAPLKAALAARGECADELHLQLVPASAETREAVALALDRVALARTGLGITKLAQGS